MGKVIFEDIRKEISELQQRLEALELRLEEAERISMSSAPEAGEAFSEPVSLDIDLSGELAAAGSEPSEILAPSTPPVAVSESAVSELSASLSPSAPSVAVSEPLASSTKPAPSLAAQVSETSVSEPESAAPESSFFESEPEATIPDLDYKWAKDECGKKISNVISGIALNDRMAIINGLCGEDPVVFQNLISSLNSCATFGEAANMVLKKYPSWDFGSAPVYSLMMAVRRKFC